ncbi:transporter substrate-binding domain-containing protein [Arcobacter sp. FWKO B]|nr:transporter substrate-binding domain-containing protein [Arcobacter sp. FWKO B]
MIALSNSELEYLDNRAVVTMCVDPDWEPFEKINEKGEYVGIAADLIRLVSKKTGLNIQVIQTKSWEETLEYSKDYKCDLLSFVNQTPARDEWLIFTEPIFSDPNVFITREEHSYIENPKKLQNESIAIPEGTSMIERFRKEFSNMTVIPVSSEEEALKMVSEKKVDMTIRSLIISAYTIKKEGLFNLKIAGQPDDYVNHLRIGVRKDEPILRDILNKGILDISQNERDDIVNKYVTIVIKKGIDKELLFYIGYVFLLFFIVFCLVLLWNYLLRKKVKQEVEKNVQQTNLLYQHSKQAEIGNLIANISHQWREPLSKIGAINMYNIYQLSMGKEIDKNQLLKDCKNIESTISFMSETMQNFLDFYKPSKESIDFNIYSSIKSAISIIEEKINKYNIEIEFDIQKDDLSIYGIKNEWIQVWLNILNNSISAMIAKKIENPKIVISINDNLVSFLDNAGGFDNIDEVNIGNNSGLGLKMCRQILAKYNSTIDFANKEQGAITIVRYTKEKLL